MPISLFYSYSHEDEELRRRLEKHLSALRRSGAIAEWHDRNIDAGEDWAKAIDDNLASADIILLLVSASFIASDYCWGKEMKGALDRHQRAEAKVIPVILKPCRWQTTPLAVLQAAPTDGKPITSWPDQESAFVDVVTKIERVVEALGKRKDRLPAETTGSRGAVPPGPSTTSDRLPGKLPGDENGKTKENNNEGKGAKPPKTPNSVRLRRLIVGISLLLATIVGVFLLNLSLNRSFRDCSECPEMVWIPKGSFTMGSPEPEAERSKDEGPQHQVQIGDSLAVGKYEVTFDEWDACVAAGGCGGHRPRDEGWGRGRRPVINVSWDDAKLYVGWLSSQTGKRYRLLSEAEWEYAARAGTTTPFAFGPTISPRQANYDGNYTYADGPKGMYRRQTVAVGSLRSNGWGLYDLHGNVWEWVEDCRNGNSTGAPGDGSAWMSGTCGERVLRGGSWNSIPGSLRSANRYGLGPGWRDYTIGFRVARRD